MWLIPDAGQETIEVIHGVIRKFGHFFNYAILAFLLLRAFRGNTKALRPEWILYSGLTALMYGLLDEYMQASMPTRTGSWYDWFIDSAGVFAVLGLFTAKNRSKFFPNPSSHR
jgi:VanZ family protein